MASARNSALPVDIPSCAAVQDVGEPVAVKRRRRPKRKRNYVSMTPVELKMLEAYMSQEGFRTEHEALCTLVTAGFKAKGIPMPKYLSES